MAENSFNYVEFIKELKREEPTTEDSIPRGIMKKKSDILENKLFRNIIKEAKEEIDLIIDMPSTKGDEPFMALASFNSSYDEPLMDLASPEQYKQKVLSGTNTIQDDMQYIAREE